MEYMREIVEAELKRSQALDCIWDKIPSEYRKELVDLVIQKMSWAFRRGEDEGQKQCV